jgi:heme a synthase
MGVFYMKNYHRLAVIALILAVIVIMLGAYTRLTDAGLGCPDWPGCYGRLVLPSAAPELTQAQKTFPEQPIVAHKAWSEMVHRYVAGTLGTLIIILAVWAVVNWRRGLPQPMITPFLLVAVLVFQAVLGMWTVTLKLLPLVVTGHLLGGMAIAGLLSWLVSATSRRRVRREMTAPFVFLLLALLVLVIQLFLGAWTSTNYAALACGSDFPACHGALWPAGMDWAHAFNIFSPIGPNYEGGRLTMALRVTIQMAHRYWALITFIYLGVISLWLLVTRSGERRLASVLLVLLCVQVSLGILNVVKLLPLAIAVAHNGVAVLLLITLITLLERSQINAK